MDTKLKERLEKYERRRPIKTDEDLIHAVGEIIEKERKKRFRRDDELIDEAVSFFFELKGLDIEAIDDAGEAANRAAIERAIENSEERARPSHLWKKLLIPVTILLSIIVASFSAIGYEVYSDPLKVFNEIKELTEGITEKGVHIKGDNYEIISGKPTIGLKTIDELIEAVEETNIYLPYGLEDEFDIRNINYIDYGEFKNLFFDLYDENGKSTFYIETRETWQIEFETVKIGNFDVNFVKYKDENRKDVYSAEFQYGGCSYQIDACSGWSLIKIFNSLEVIKK